MTDALGPGRLLLIVTSATMHDAVRAQLRQRVDAGEIRELRRGVIMIYAEAECAEVRDWLSPALPGGETAFVVEFERWSARGEAIDAAWLLRRGH